MNICNIAITNFIVYFSDNDWFEEIKVKRDINYWKKEMMPKLQ